MSAEVEFVDTDTGEVIPVCSAQEARDLTDQIKTAVDTTWHLVKRAYSERAWEALGYASWDDYCTREFGAQRLRLPREERREVVGSLREAGLSVRAIAAATGDGVATVSRDLDAGVPNGTPEPEPPRNGEWHDGPPPAPEPAPEPQPVQGRDGKTYKPSKPVQGERDNGLTEEQQRERDAEQAIERAQRRLENLVSAWPQLEALPGHKWRDRILAGLTDADRERIEAIEAIYVESV